MAELSEPLENYLKEIYELEEMKGHARVTDIINDFNISPGTISKALSKLEKLGLIKRDNKRLTLTEEGRKIAERLIKSHRLSERLLTDILGIDWIRAHELAHRLEHIWPEDIIEKIDVMLNKPSTCPHGHPIPGRGIKINGVLLTEAEVGKLYKISMIVKEEEWILAMVNQKHIIPGTKIEVLGKDQNITKVKINDRIDEIPNVLATQILVERIL
ncbi:metal-dependent transcriptional regulator [Sulfolobus acidocaldarius]|uniref:Iron dependent repressor n=4 Tax=Sulfolobus acidocaldarius TaxID=2285 RepID=Q4JCE2_SULAC|nr:metal-dependent transcriptional regulator [Sulfolobus acidocaldarius]AAY79537.1 iron dependent repressor [Sulfolobus acidocaldarius DSM 639]AGE70087.1 iron dependent repressor [Sulfolobus acidocaldarius N8]AGE72362.1 iron dependent repressor [Sulfolobus acidocaldarius Ron12/I]ALU29492.1 DtxR family transcriptional regulator [Sulfolobus acidocaldarius]ALU32221.1 DtxR family transcriptional regulator [Sulfolobus acidocaldarius]